jgi:ribonucleoside-diphosphate reductase alpha chain
MQVLQVNSSKEQGAEPELLSLSGLRFKRLRPLQMQGVTERVRTGHGNTYITINYDQEKQPFEVFTTLGKAGSCDSANLEAITRLVSLALRSGVLAEDIVDQLQGITCHPVWDQGVMVRSGPDALAQVLRKHTLQESDETVEPYGAQLGLEIANTAVSNTEMTKEIKQPVSAVGFSCPECSGPVAFQEGCVICQACAWNQCGG